MTIRARERAEMTALYRLIVALALSLILWLQLPTPLDDLLGPAAGYIAAALVVACLALGANLLWTLRPRSRRALKLSALAVLLIGIGALVVSRVQTELLGP